MTTGTQRSLINVTPLIDILLVLLLIMMVITPITSHGLPADVPEPAKDHATNASQPPLILRMDREGRLWLNQDAVAESEFERRLTQALAQRADPVLFVDGDAELPFAAIARMVDRARGLGFSRTAILPPSRR